MAVRVHRPLSGDMLDAPIKERRLNVLLNDFGQIILLDCG
jgi:hypothetical protein